MFEFELDGRTVGIIAVTVRNEETLLDIAIDGRYLGNSVFVTGDLHAQYFGVQSATHPFMAARALIEAQPGLVGM
jgi:hypothetical protein